MPVNLIINADDFCYSATRDGGIASLLEAGHVTDCSVMVTGSAFCTEAAQRLLRLPLLPGLHVNLTEGRPLSPPESVPSLVGADGRLLGKEGLRDGLDGVSTADVRRELTAQFRAFSGAFGSAPSHVDGHQHCHALPGIARVFAEVAKDAGCLRTRLPAEASLATANWVAPDLAEFNARVVADCPDAAVEFANAGLAWPSGFFGLTTMGASMTVRRAADRLANQPAVARDANGDAWVEWMVHPGIPCARGDIGVGGDPVDQFAVSEDRRHEMRVLASGQLKELLASEGVQLRRFQDMPIE